MCPPHGPVVDGFALRSISKPIGALAAEPRARRGEINFVVDLVLFAGPAIANGISQPKPAVSGIGGRRLEFDSKLVIVGREFQAAFDIRARLDGSCSDQGIDIEPPCALNRRPSALSSASIIQVGVLMSASSDFAA